MKIYKNKVYILINEDRHYDTEVDVFSDPDDAINRARVTATQACEQHDFEYKENDVSGWENCLLLVNYSCEGDSLRVMEVELDKLVEKK